MPHMPHLHHTPHSLLEDQEALKHSPCTTSTGSGSAR